MFKGIILLIVILVGIGGGILIFWQEHSQGYSANNTHPVLAEQTAKLYNRIYGQWLTDQEIEWLKQGAVNEDQPPRWINHFYDPTTGQGWNAQRMGSVPQSVVSLIATIGLAHQEPLSALDWAHNQEIQTKYTLYFGNRTFERAVFDYSQNNKQRAFQSLGHILHLIEDMTVPAHTRQDTHLDFLDDPGEPYEKWAKEQTNQYGLTSLASLDELAANYQSICQGIDDCLIKSAKYCNQNFFSEDTIRDKFYALPQWQTTQKEEINGEILKYGTIEGPDAVSYRLVLLVGESAFSWKDELGGRQYTVKDDKIHQDYWQRLSKQAILAGVETIRYFKQETEKASIYPPESYQSAAAFPASRFATPLMYAANELFGLTMPQVPLVSPYGEAVKADSWWDKTKTAITDVWHQATTGIGSAWNKAGDFLGNLAGVFSEQEPPPSVWEGESGPELTKTDKQEISEQPADVSSSEPSSIVYQEPEVKIWQAEAADQSPDLVLLPGQTANLWLELINQGTSWQVNQVSLNIWQISGDQAITWQDVYDGSWLTRRRPAVIEKSVGQNQTGYLDFRINTSQLESGKYTLKFRPVYQDETGFYWLGNQIISWQLVIGQASDLAKIASTRPEQEDLGIPSLTPPTSLKKPTPDQTPDIDEDKPEETTKEFEPFLGSQAGTATMSSDQPQETGDSAETPPTSTPLILKPERPLIVFPENGSTITHSPVLFGGGAASSTFKIIIQLNNATSTLETLVLPDNSWQKEIDLIAGENQLQVWAEDDQGQLSEKVIWQIFLDQLGPEIILSIIDYQMISGQITLFWQPARPADAREIKLFLLEDKPPDGLWQELWQTASSTQKTFSGFISGLYQFRACGQDTLGNQGPWSQIEVLFEEHPLVINEIAWMGTKASTSDEWLEIYNQTNQSIDLTGWTLSAQDGSPEIQLSGTIEPMGYFLLERTDDSVIDDIPANLIYTGALENSGENLILKDQASNIIDQVDFSTGWPEGDNDNKMSMERIKPELAGSDAESWMTHLGPIRNGFDAKGYAVWGTPGARNSYLQAGGTKLPIDMRIQGTVVWQKKYSPYLLPFNMDDYVLVEPGATLVIEPGVVLKMSPYYLGLRVFGTLEAVGRPDEPIIFEPYNDRDAWSAVVFEPDSQAIFANVNFISGGGKGFYHEGGGWSAEHWTQAAVVAKQATINFSDCHFEDIRIGGIKLSETDSVIENCNFSGGSVQIGLFGGSPLIKNNVFENNISWAGYGLEISSASPQILNNQFDGVATLAFLKGGSPNFSGNTSQNIQTYDGILVDDQARFSEDLSWQPNFPYILEVNFYDQARVMSGATLTIEPGVVVKTMGSPTRGYESLIIEGSLIAQAATSTPIVFTRLEDDRYAGDTNCDASASSPQPDSWGGLEFKNSSSGSILDGVIFHFAKDPIIKESPGVDLIIGHIKIY